MTDCGKQFIGHLFTNICKELGIHKLRTTPYHPATNGILERFHKTLKTNISHFVSNFMESWDEILPYALMAYRNQPHEATKESPYFLMFGRDMELPIHLTINDHVLRYDLDENYASEMLKKMQISHELAKENLAKSIESRYAKHNSRKLKREFQLGDLVFMKIVVPTKGNLAAKFQPKWKGPFRIIEKKGPVTFKIKELSGRTEHMIHAERLTPYKNTWDCVEENKN